MVLDKIPSDTLVWTNAYFVNDKSNKTAWLNKFVEKRNLALIGSNAEALKNLLKKDTCQTILSKANILIPNFAVLSVENTHNIEQFFLECTIDYPMVLKPTKACLSLDVCLVNNYK